MDRSQHPAYEISSLIIWLPKDNTFLAKYIKWYNIESIKSQTLDFANAFQAERIIETDQSNN